MINWGKVEITQQFVFLGIEMDSNEMYLKFRAEKFIALQQRVGCFLGSVTEQRKYQSHTKTIIA